MKATSKWLAAIVGSTVILLALTVPAMLRADQWDKETTVTMDHQTQVPGAILEPNVKYVIRKADLLANRTVVEVYTDHKFQILTTFMAIPEHRLEPVEDTTFEFMEVPAGNPVPIKSWFFPGDMTGLEFLYSDAEAKQIAGYSQTPVLTEQLASLQPETTTAEARPEENTTASVEPAPVEQPAEVAQVAQNDKTEVDTIREKPAEPEPVAQEPATTDNNSSLPATAGELPLLGLSGALALALGLGVRFAFRRS